MTKKAELLERVLNFGAFTPFPLKLQREVTLRIGHGTVHDK
jgi:hypothetical protein